jgi:hypothetical protein
MQGPWNKTKQMKQQQLLPALVAAELCLVAENQTTSCAVHPAANHGGLNIIEQGHKCHANTSF